MNYLAHAYLSGIDEQLLLGNFIADGIRGNKIGHLPGDVLLGIRLHRYIDSFTDEHPTNAEVRKLLQPAVGKYAGVVLDVFYDHLLASAWSDFHPDSLDDYTRWCYSVIQKNEHLLPEKTKAMLPYMINGNWLLNYAHETGLLRTLGGLSRRIPQAVDLVAGGKLALEHKTLIWENFEVFFNELRANVIMRKFAP